MTGKPTEARVEDQQASRQVPVRMRLLRRRGHEVQRKSHEGISITPAAGAQRHEGAAVKFHSQTNRKKVNCKEINLLMAAKLFESDQNQRRERRKFNEIRDFWGNKRVGF